MIEYNKLVRDKIPQAIEGAGSTCTIHTLDEDAFFHKLLEKLAEESQEYQESRAPEELADLLEVIYALAGLEGMTVAELEQRRLVKRSRRGGFDARILLERVDPV